MAGVSADVEHSMRQCLGERPFDESCLASMVFGAVVTRSRGVVAPAGGARRRRKGVKGSAELLQRAAQNLDGDLRRLLTHRRGARGRGGIGLALQQMREGDERAEGRRPGPAEREVGIEVRRFVTVTALNGGGEGPAEIAVRG